ncbi:MAG: aspartate-semialdehyde dehydrogenase [Acidimicrobiia bacterium]
MRVAILGGTGLVGTEMISILASRNFPIDELVVFASPRSEGKILETPYGDVTCKVVKSQDDFAGCDYVIIDVDDPIALELAPLAANAGAKVIDKSATFRMEEDVPLVIPEINSEDIKNASRNIVSTPNCTTTILLMAIAPLHKQFGLERMVVSSYQSVSGAGQAGLEELKAQWKQHGFDDDLNSYLRSSSNDSLTSGGEVWSKAIAGNVIPLAGSIKEEGYTSEEIKLVKETQKILHDDSLKITATCVRVPVFVGHAMAVNASFKTPIDAEKAAEILRNTPGVAIDANNAEGSYPTPVEIAGIDEVHVGRLRNDNTAPNTINFWVTGDNLRKGAALNAAQILEEWVKL